MTKIKFCGLSRICDIENVNELKPDYVGFVFAPKSRRYVTYEKAAELLHNGVIDMAQLHGDEDEAYIAQLRLMTDKTIIKAFRVETSDDIEMANQSGADYILLDSGAGSGTVFDWELLKSIRRPYFLAGGLDIDNVTYVLKTLNPFAVDVSSGIETNGSKDKAKMAAFAAAVRKEYR